MRTVFASSIKRASRRWRQGCYIKKRIDSLIFHRTAVAKECSRRPRAPFAPQPRCAGPRSGEPLPYPRFEAGDPDHRRSRIKAVCCSLCDKRRPQAGSASLRRRKPSPSCRRSGPSWSTSPSRPAASTAERFNIGEAEDCGVGFLGDGRLADQRSASKRRLSISRPPAPEPRS